MPPGVVTATATGPAVPAGVVAVICVALSTTTPVASVPPTVTLVAPVKFVPVITTLVLPAVGPALGATPLIVGGFT